MKLGAIKYSWGQSGTIKNNKSGRKLTMGAKEIIVLITENNEKIKYIAEDWL